jgi:hypothetical protein
MDAGRPHNATTKTMVFRIAARWNPHRHPILSVKTPPSVRPIEKPTGCPPPIDAKAKFLRLPSRVEVMILTAEGRQNAMATPLRARNRIISLALRASPQPRVKNDCRIEPAMYMNLEPRASAIEPESRRVQPHVKAWIEDGLNHASVSILSDYSMKQAYHSIRLSGMSRSLAIVGRMTVVKPLSNELIPVIRVTDATTIAVVDFEVFVGALSSPRKDISSLRALLTTVEGLLVLGVLAKTDCGTCGAAI